MNGLIGKKLVLRQVWACTRFFQAYWTQNFSKTNSTTRSPRSQRFGTTTVIMYLISMAKLGTSGERECTKGTKRTRRCRLCYLSVILREAKFVVSELQASRRLLHSPKLPPSLLYSTSSIRS